MRYTEKESFQEDGVLQKVLCAVTAPLRLCRELSTKFIFLKRSLIEKVLLVAIFFAAIGVLIDLILAKLMGNVHWFEGKFPFICRVVGLGVIVLLYLFYELHEFTIYKQINKLVMNCVVHKENVDDTGIASELFSSDNIDTKAEKDDTPELDLSLLDSGPEDMTISIDPSLFDSTGGMSDSISLDDMFENISVKEATKEESIDNPLLEKSSGEQSTLTELEEPIELPETEYESSSLPEDNIQLQEKSLAIDIENGQEVIDYQNQLNTCVNDLILAGLEYVGTLSSDDIIDIENEINNADSYEEAAIAPEIIEKGVSFEYEKDLEILDLQKSWKIPDTIKDVI